ncbi:alkyl hydroperoxide reductase subunit F [Litorivivens lipolytica]|uniref:Alkyl hydroperoxide reductase subunit F n=1 Tax=Litorivivens lipolytica TaxID=1524264 RepID=A0A7W4W8A8_9GAMM|nr:alkyl hydroperoxide reductase subunit F [Litorivivens lipolytica]MBB3048672.1 alkyl hydroperoxide reductase subunit F [Litorivivens lipolytica]
MLSNDLLEALKGYTEKLTTDVTLVLQTGEHEKRDELRTFLQSVVSVSDHLTLEERDAALRSPVSFLIENSAGDTGIRFSGIPGGHEFNSLVLAILQSGGVANRLDDTVKGFVSAIQKPLNFEVFVSLSCHNCPEVVQALNQFALSNPNSRAEMIDGGVFPALVEERKLQGVPAVFLNGKPFANGKVGVAALFDKLRAAFPETAIAPAEDLPTQDVTVIGGGPAGVSAAIYAARKGLKVTLIADRLGGQVKDTRGIENLISVPQTTGTQLTGNLREHLQSYDITMREHVRVDRIVKAEVKSILLSSGERIDSKTLIVATGAQWRELGVPGEKENIGKGVAYCPHCDGPFFKGKDVAVIGGGNSGIEAALDLSGIVKSVTVFEFAPNLKADEVLIRQAKSRSNITLLTNVATEEVLAEEGRVSGIAYQDRASGDSKQQRLDGIFVQIGLLPNSGFLKDVVELTERGEVVVNSRGETSEPGIFACGDVTTVPFKQIVVALGEGAKASLAAFEYLLTEADASAEAA